MKTVHVLRRLTDADRCDRCTAPASIAVLFSTGELAFCPTHYLKHGEALIFSGALITGLSKFIDDGRTQ